MAGVDGPSHPPHPQLVECVRLAFRITYTSECSVRFATSTHTTGLGVINRCHRTSFSLETLCPSRAGASRFFFTSRKESVSR